MPMSEDKTIFSINIEDVQNVAEEEIGRTLTGHELGIIVEKIGDQFPWYDALASLISEYVQTGEDESADDGFQLRRQAENLSEGNEGNLRS